MNNIKCIGNETEIKNCTHRKFDGYGYGQLAGVGCIDHGEKNCDNKQILI